MRIVSHSNILSASCLYVKIFYKTIHYICPKDVCNDD